MSLKFTRKVSMLSQWIKSYKAKKTDLPEQHFYWSESTSKNRYPLNMSFLMVTWVLTTQLLWLKDTSHPEHIYFTLRSDRHLIKATSPKTQNSLFTVKEVSKFTWQPNKPIRTSWRRHSFLMVDRTSVNSSMTTSCGQVGSFSIREVTGLWLLAMIRIVAKSLLSLLMKSTFFSLL